LWFGDSSKSQIHNPQSPIPNPYILKQIQNNIYILKQYNKHYNNKIKIKIKK